MRKLSMQELGRVEVETFKNAPKLPLIVVLDSIRSMHNVGSVFRSSDCFAVEKIILCGITARPPHREIEKTALGATESVNWEYYEHIEEALLHLKKENYVVCAIEQVTNSVSLKDFVPEQGNKYAFIFGNEVNGVSEEALQHVDTSVEIPQFGTKHSFNISVTAGIVLWDFYNKIS